jgi:ribosomal protein S18 acetylase RimI-like enzyme
MDGEGDTSTTTRPGRPEDARRVAELHAGQITTGFLSLLGPRFLTRLYRRMARSPHAFVLVAEPSGGQAPAGTQAKRTQATPGRDPVGPRETGGTGGTGEVVGFVAGATDLTALYRSFLVRDGVPAALVVAPRLVLSWRRALETLRHGQGGAGTARGAELLAIAVDPAATGRGTGRQLVDGFLAEVVARGIETAYVVVGATNERAVALYRRAGFAEAERFELHRGTESLVLTWDLG